MEYKRFKNMVEVLRDITDRENELYDLDIDITNFLDPYMDVVNTLLEEILTEEQQDWFDWFCWENDFGRGGLEAWNKDKKPIVEDIKGLYNEIFKK